MGAGGPEVGISEYYEVAAGLTAYAEAEAVQTRLVMARQSGRLSKDVVLWLEHPPVFTLGLRGGRDNLRVAEAFLAQRGIALAETKRGGNITYHGPGQLVAYPILDLRKARIDVPSYVEMLETVMLMTCRDFDVVADRSPLNRGIWKDGRKLGSIGIAIRGGVSYHGFALNVSPDLTPFDWINPCGLKEIRMTSIARETGGQVTAETARVRAARHFETVFGGRPERITVKQMDDLLWRQ